MFVLMSISALLVTQPGVMSFVSGGARRCVGEEIFVFDDQPLQFGFAAERTHPPYPGKRSNRSTKLSTRKIQDLRQFKQTAVFGAAGVEDRSAKHLPASSWAQIARILYRKNKNLSVGRRGEANARQISVPNSTKMMNKK